MGKVSSDHSNRSINRFGSVEKASTRQRRVTLETQIHQEPSTASRVENEIDEAVRQIYKKYGSDLSAFFSDVQHNLSLERSYEPGPRRSTKVKGVRDQH